jgi:Calcineurin-like phosphoesterase
LTDPAKQVTWLHLSDWHQKGSDFDRRVVRDALIKDIEGRERIDPELSRVDFVIFSGDLAFGGKPTEYAAARQYLLDPVLDAVGLERSRLFVVPGNHDLSRETVYEMLPTELQRPLDSDASVQKWLDGQKRARTLEPFEAYRDFVSQYTGQPAPDYASIVRLDVSGTLVALLGLNSAWMNARNKDLEGEVNDYGYTLIGEPQIHDSLAQIADAELRIAVVHHPFDWLREFDRNRTEARLCRECHFILRGHVHNPQVYVMGGTEGDCVIIPAGASYDRRVAANPRYVNAYNWVRLDFEASQGTVYLRRWSDRRNEWIEDIDSHIDGKFVLHDLPKDLGKKRADLNVPPTAPLLVGPPSRFERELIVLEGYLNALVSNNTDLDAGGIKQTKMQVVLPLDEIYVGLHADLDRPDVDRRVMQEELDDIKKRLEREEDPNEREKQYRIWAHQARTLQQALEISGPREDLANIVQRHRQVVILGDPGSGKTTLVRYLTLRLARAILAEPERLLQTQDLWDEKSVWRLPDLGPVRLPILLRISHYAEARQKNPDLALVDYLPRYFAGLSVPHADELGPILQSLLDKGRCTVMMDGLDEIIDPTDRRNIAAAIGQFVGVYRETGLPDWLAGSLAFSPVRTEEKHEVGAEREDEEPDIIIQWDKNVPEDVRQKWGRQIKHRRMELRRRGRAVRLAWELLDEARYAHVGNRFVVTSRIAGYHFAGVPGEFEHYTIRRMSLEDIKLFLEKWCPAVERRIAATPDLAQVEQRSRREREGILQAVETTPGVRRMAENPLLLRILAIIHRNEAHLPQRRVELYETASVTLLRDWHLERGVKGAAIDDVKATSLLGPVAFYIHENRASGFLSKGETERILAGILARERGEKDPEQPSLETREAVHHFLETVREHSGLFVERGEGLYGFMHLTFEEYFTARQLVSSSTRARAQILERLHLPRWREPILLAVGSLSKQFYDDTHDLLRAILDVGSAYEGMLHRDLLFAATCVGDSVNVAPVMRQEIAKRLLALYCDRRRAGRYRLLQQQVKDALVTLCNDQGDAAVEAALAETLMACDDRAALMCALDAAEWLKARTPAVARALLACPSLGVLPRAQNLLRAVQERLPGNGNGTRSTPVGWDAVRDVPALARLMGLMLRFGLRDASWSSLGITKSTLDNAYRELRSLSVFHAVGLAKSLPQRFDETPIEQRNMDFWKVIADTLQAISRTAPEGSEIESAAERLMQAVAGSLSNRADTWETARDIEHFLEEKRRYSHKDEPRTLPLDQALAQFRNVLSDQGGAVRDLDSNQVFQSAGAHLLKAASSGHTLAATFVAAAERFDCPPLRPGEQTLRAKVQSLESEIDHAMLALLRLPANGQQYNDAALFLGSTGLLPGPGSKESFSDEVATLICTDLEGADATRRAWALQALTSQAVSNRVQLTDLRRNLLLGLLDAATEQAAQALEILFSLDITSNFLSACWSLLRRVDHPLSASAREKLDGVKEVKGDRSTLVLLDEGLRDHSLRAAALELLLKVKWDGLDTLEQALTWLSGNDIQVRHSAALLLATQEDLRAIPRSILVRATKEWLQATTSAFNWSAQRQHARLVRLLGGLWLNGWDNALTQLLVAHPAEQYVDQKHPKKYWRSFRSYPESEECIRWLLENASLGQGLLPIFLDAAARLVELEGDVAQGAPDAAHIAEVQQEIVHQIDAIVAQSVTRPLLRVEASILASSIRKETVPSISLEMAQVGLNSADNDDWFAALSRLAPQQDQQSLVVSVLTGALESTDRERRLRTLLLLFERETLREAMGESLTTRFLKQEMDANEALCGLSLMLQLKRPPGGLYPWLRSLCTSDNAHPLSVLIRQTLTVHELTPDSPSAALAHLLADPDARAPASVALLATDMIVPLMEDLVEMAHSPDDRVRKKGEERLYYLCRKLPSDGSTAAIETLLRFYQDAEACKDGHLGTVSMEAVSSVIHNEPFWVARWLETMNADGPAQKLPLKGLSVVREASVDVLSLMCSALSDPTRPVAARRVVAEALGEILKRQDRRTPPNVSIQGALTTALGDPDRGLRRCAAYSLQWTVGPDAWPGAQALLRAAQTDTDAYTSILALRSLGRLLQTVRGFRNLDVSKEALFRWLETQTKDFLRYQRDEVAETVKQTANLLGINEVPDAEGVLAALEHLDTLGLPEDVSARLRDSERWSKLLKSGHQEWELRRYWLATLPLMPTAIAQIEVFLSARNPAMRRAAANALARLYVGDDNRPGCLQGLLPDDATLLRAMLDAASDRDEWRDEGGSIGSDHAWSVKQIVGWLEARPSQERSQLIDGMLADLDKAMKGMREQDDEEEEGDTDTYPDSGWPARRILTIVLAELSERLTYRAFTHTRDLGNVVDLFNRAATDPYSYNTRRFAIRGLGNLQQLNRQVADVFFAACQDVGTVYRETRTAVTKFKAFDIGSLERLTAAIRSPSITVAYHAALLLGELGVSRSEDLGREGRHRVADELVQLLDDPIADRIVYDFSKGSGGERVGPMYDVVYDALVRVVAGPDAPVSARALEAQ